MHMRGSIEPRVMTCAWFMKGKETTGVPESLAMLRLEEILRKNKSKDFERRGSTRQSRRMNFGKGR